jgi:nicotinate-nucleotide pyrophosphorylase (carboxylating)
MLIKPGRDAIHRLVRIALDEDAPWGDLTSQALIAASARITAQLVAREPGVLSGEDVFIAAMSLTDPGIETRFAVHDGDSFSASMVLATVEGPAQGILQAERVGLNFVQRMSGIATLTAQYVSAIAGSGARVVDTRKTTPGLRLVERYAVRCGGGHNHRYSLSDTVMVKDNHLAIVAAEGAGDVTEALRSMRARLPHTTHVEVEVDRPEQIKAVLAAGADTILLDNFTIAELRAAVAQIAGRALAEASGGITLAGIREVAETGVDIISVGALTHSVRSLDLGLDILSQPH